MLCEISETIYKVCKRGTWSHYVLCEISETIYKELLGCCVGAVLLAFGGVMDVGGGGFLVMIFIMSLINVIV